MSKPSFSNIDLWLFELSEGNLTPTQVEQLKMFLMMHPELDVDKDVWESARLEKTELVYTKKESLKRDFPIFWFLDMASAAAVITGIIIFGFITSDPIPNRKIQSSNLEVENADFQKSISAKTNIVSRKSRRSSNSINVNAASVNNINISKSTKAFLKSSQLLFDSNEEEATEKVSEMTEISTIESEVSNLEINQRNLDETPIPVNSLATTDDYIEFSHFDYGLILNDNQTESYLDDHKTEVKRYSSSYNLTFKSKLGAFGRKVRNMMDNPIALKNFRDPHYSIPGLSVADVNFSSSGNQLSSRAQTLTRLQWLGEQNQQIINQLNVDGYVYGMRGGLGLQVNHATYRNGGVSIADVSLTYSPKIAISNNVSFEPALRFKMGNKNLRHSKMEGVNQVEVERGVVEDYYADGSQPIGRNLWYQDFGVGFMVNTKWFFAGVQMDNLFRHKDNMYANTSFNPQRSNYHFTASLGTDWVSSKGTVRLSPYAVYQNEGRLNELWAGANLGIKWFVIGASYSTNQDPSATIGVKFKHFSMYYNADFSKSKLTGDRNLSHQLTLKVVGKQSRFGKGR